jgi:hypothetical protein
MMADPGGPGAQPDSDVYTVLVMIATAFLAVGTIFVAVRSADVFGNWLPFSF